MERELSFQDLINEQKKAQEKVAKHQEALLASQARLNKLTSLLSSVKVKVDLDSLDADLDSVPKATVKAEATVTKTVAAKSRKNVTEGCGAVARGDRPPLKKAMIMVMGTKVLNATEVYEALEAKDWLPNSEKPRQYISYMFSSNTPEVFERTERRGYYRVRPGAGEKVQTKAPKAAKASKAAKAPKAAKASVSDPTVDSKLQAFGEDVVDGNISVNPFDSV